jgi:hypothetical protein
MFMRLLSMSNTLAQGLFALDSCLPNEVTRALWSTFDAVVVRGSYIVTVLVMASMLCL